VLLLRPRPVVGRLAPEYPADKDWVVRLLGARLVVQHAVVLAAHDRRRTAHGGVAVDALHALSMLPLAGSATYGRAALISAGTTGASGALTAALAGRSRLR
jgi:hypothetical protein